jgi:hypothetical protein
VSRNRLQRAGGIGAILAIVLLVAPAAFAAGGNTVLARFKWSVSGSLKHAWSISSTDPCAPVGDGLISATFTGKGRDALKVERNQYGTTYNFDPQLNLRGKITEADNTTQNPPEAGDSPCRPTDKSRCGTRALKDGFGYLEPGANNGFLLDWEAVDFGNAFSAGDCETGGFGDYGRVSGRFLPKFYPGVPAPKALAKRHGRLVLRAKRRDSRNGGADVQTRTVTLTLTRLR